MGGGGGGGAYSSKYVIQYFKLHLFSPYLVHYNIVYSGLTKITHLESVFFCPSNNIRYKFFKTCLTEPDGAPQNVTGHKINSTSISVSWEEVEADKQNGDITGYTITYRSQTENHSGNVTAGPNDRRKDITGLKEYVFYNITVLASTAIGNGPSSTPVLVVRTDEDSKFVLQTILVFIL